MSLFAPLQDWLLVELLEPLDQTAGGIALPDSCVRNDTTGIVLECGPGLWTSAGYSVVWVEPGMTVMADARHTRPGPDSKQVFVRDDDLLAVLNGDEVKPLNAHVLVEPDPAEMERNGIMLPDVYQRRRARCGIVRAIGNGKVRRSGAYRATRKSIRDIIGRELHEGDKVYWQHESDGIAFGRHSCKGLLVPASALCAVEEMR